MAGMKSVGHWAPVCQKFTKAVVMEDARRGGSGQIVTCPECREKFGLHRVGNEGTLTSGVKIYVLEH